MVCAFVLSCGSRTGLVAGQDAFSSEVGDASSEETPDAQTDARPEAVPPEDATPPDDAPVVLSLGYQHGCAVDRGRVRCWGYNGHGQLGDGTNEDRRVAVEVSGLRDVAEVACGGNASCARTHAGDAYCWGAGGFGQLGSGAWADARGPVRVPLSGVAQISVGAEHACAALGDGSVWCWGNAAHGAIGRSAGVACGAGSVCDAKPARVTGIDGVALVAAGAAATCAVRRNGEVWCWGRNQFGQLGDGSTIERATPAAASGLRARRVGMGSSHACALLHDGNAHCWGSNMNGKLGMKDPGSTDCDRLDLSPPFSLTPRAVDAVDAADTLAVGANHTCVARRDGAASCWGTNYCGELGDARSSTTGEPCSVGPRALARFEPTAVLAAGSGFSCAITRSGRRYCWGKNLFGQLGDGTTEDRFQPTPMVW